MNTPVLAVDDENDGGELTEFHPDGWMRKAKPDRSGGGNATFFNAPR